jgi:hypothetical protein
VHELHINMYTYIVHNSVTQLDASCRVQSAQLHGKSEDSTTSVTATGDSQGSHQWTELFTGEAGLHAVDPGQHRDCQGKAHSAHS